MRGKEDLTLPWNVWSKSVQPVRLTENLTVSGTTTAQDSALVMREVSRDWARPSSSSISHDVASGQGLADARFLKNN